MYDKEIVLNLLSHHYFDLNAEVVFEVTTEHIEELQGVLKQIVLDME